jgi:hypothetical protein
VTAVADDLDPVGVAGSAAEAVRTLNHLTLTAPSAGLPGWEDVGDLYGVLGELQRLVERLPQSLRQVARHLEQSIDSYAVDEAAPESPASMVAGAVVALADAGTHLRRASESLGMAHSATAHLYTPTQVGAPTSTAVG